MMKWMMSLIAFLVLVIVFLIVWGFKQPEQEIKQAQTNRIVREIQYIKDPRTGQCFAWHSVSGNGVSLATVPCDCVPREMLFTGK